MHPARAIFSSSLRADALLGTVLHPRFLRALFGIDKVSDEWPDADSNLLLLKEQGAPVEPVYCGPGGAL